MAKQSKRFRALAEKRKTKTPLPIADAVKTLKSFDGTKFDQSVEIAIRLGIDHTQADQIVRGSIVLPHGIGKQQRVVVFAKGAKAEEAKAAGADDVGEEDLAEKIKGGWTEFDACIAAPDMMKLVGPLGKVLGPRGLMPSPRAGTVTPDVGKTVERVQGGQGRVPQRQGRHRAGRRRQAELRRAEARPRTFKRFSTRCCASSRSSVKGTYVKSVAHQRDDEPERAVGSVGDLSAGRLSRPARRLPAVTDPELQSNRHEQIRQRPDHRTTSASGWTASTMRCWST